MPNRRKVLIGLGGSVAIAGCTGDTDEEEPEPEEEEPEQEEEEPEPDPEEEEEEPEEEEEEEPEEEEEEPDPPQIEIIEINSRDKILNEDDLDVHVDVENRGGQTGVAVVEVNLGGPQQSEQVEIEPDGGRTVRFGFEDIPSGQRDIEASLSDEEVTLSDSVEVLEPEIDLTYDIESTQVIGQDQTVDITLENEIDLEITTNLMFEFGGVERSEHVTIEPNSSETITFDYEVPEVGSYAQFAETAGETVLEEELDLVDILDSFIVSDSLGVSAYDCSGLSAYIRHLRWQVEVSNATGFEVDEIDVLTLELEFFDTAGRSLGGAVISGEPPGPDAPAIWDIVETDFNEVVRASRPSCEYVDRILDAVDEGGEIEIIDVSW